MPKVHHVKAAKDYPAHGILKGEMHYTWSMRAGGPYSKGTVYRQKTPPTARQLTSNPFRLAIMDIEEQQAAIRADDRDQLEADRDDLASNIRTLAEEQEEKLDNMGDGLRQGPTGQQIEERKDALESWADEIEGVGIPTREGETDDEWAEALEEAAQEIRDCAYSGD